MARLSILQQYINEAESWSRLLTFIKEETIYFKTRLTEVANSEMDIDAKTGIETWKEDLIGQDYVIEFLSNQIAQQLKMLQEELYKDNGHFNSIMKAQKRLRKDMKKEELLSAKVRHSINSYLMIT